MTREPNSDLRIKTRAAFQLLGGQSDAAKKLGVSRAYVWQILNGLRSNDEYLLQLSDFIIEKANRKKVVDSKKDKNTKLLKQVLA